MINWQTATGQKSYTECTAYFPMAFTSTYQIVGQVSDNWSAGAHASVERTSLSYFSYSTRASTNEEKFFNHSASFISIGF